MNFYAIRNLRSSEAQVCYPWESDTPPPEEASNPKTKGQWRTSASTNHEFYSAFEGLNPNVRVTEKGIGGDDGNPPAIMHGLVADIDQRHTDEAVDKAVASFPAEARPMWVERSVSGNLRLVWVFEKPIKVASGAFAETLLRTFLSRWGIDDRLGGLDKAFTSYTQYYCNGGNWRQVGSETSDDAVKTVVYRAAISHRWSDERQAHVIPLDKIREELLKDDRFIERWGVESSFEVNSRGRTWWVEGSDSPNSAVVFTTGMYTFAAHATKSFYPWSELLDYNFVKSYSDRSASAATDGIYFDGKQYYRKLIDGKWKAFGKEDIMTFLTSAKGLSAKKPKGDGASDAVKAVLFIQEHHYVDGAVPVVFRPEGLVEVNGKSVLNTSTKRVIRPAPVDCPAWGENFEYIASVVDALFPVSYEGRKYFLSWLSVFYKMALSESLSSGHNVVVAGGAGMGKTLLQRGIIAKLFGGMAEAGDYLMGKDSFGGELFENALWCLDDASVAANREMHRVFSEAIKKMAANRTHKVHAKYAMPAQTMWQGRVMVSCNDDAQSVQMLPAMDMSIADKLILLRVPAGSRKPEFLPFAEGEAVIGKELPHFARFLECWTIPEECADPDPRFGGLRHWADPYLVRTANHSSSTAPLAEILDDFMTSFAAMSPSSAYWEGTAAQLHAALNADTGRKESMRSYPLEKLMTQLTALVQKGYRIELASESPHRIWRLPVPSDEAKVPKPAVTVDAVSSNS